MKRLVIALGIAMLALSMPAWGQSITTTVTARQQADEAAVKAARQQADEAAAKAREAERTALRQQVSPDILWDIQNFLSQATRFPTVATARGGGYNVVVNSG